jgi:8-oxo-dGTP diphosphatase
MGKRDRLPDSRPDVEVWAAGGVLWRFVDEQLELLLVHRDHREDWSFPKGKLDPDETLRQCAVREVEEETGLCCSTGEPLALVEYRDGRGRDKAVRYWLMQVESGRFEPNDEVDACAWFDPDSARSTLTYARDRALVDEAESVIASSTIAP